MVKFSRFAHVYDLGDAVALYHSLRMKPVYLATEAYKSLQAWLAGSSCNSISEAPASISEEVEQLAKFKILTQADDEDQKVLKFVRSRAPVPGINICYMILSEQCNLACKYCFLGNNQKEKRNNFSLQNMSLETADKAIEFFIRQMKLSGFDSEENKPTIIFYGGEPLMNYPVLVHIAEKFNSLRNKEKCVKNLTLSMVTNGTLLTRDRLIELNELGVGIGISIDGFTEKANCMRVNTSGKPIFSKILQVLDLCKEVGVDISLSVTLSEETLKSTKDILRLVQDYNIRSFGFNIMMSDGSFVMSDDYNEKASRFIIDEFIELRKLGIYEDRIMRKLKTFSKSQVYFSDCAATAGGQIVVAPSGRVGICQGCLADKKFFVSNVHDTSFDATKDPTFIEWSKLTPVNKDECLDCPALGICGGGCPVNAMNISPENTIHSIDKRACAHSKITLDFLIRDLYRIIQENQNEREN